MTGIAFNRHFNGDGEIILISRRASAVGFARPPARRRLHYSDYFSGPAEVHEAEVCPPTWHLVPGTYGKLTTPVEPPEAAEIKSQTAGCASDDINQFGSRSRTGVSLSQ